VINGKYEDLVLCLFPPLEVIIDHLRPILPRLKSRVRIPFFFSLSKNLTLKMVFVFRVYKYLFLLKKFFWQYFCNLIRRLNSKSSCKSHFDIRRAVGEIERNRFCLERSVKRLSC
jgi:hypothetical protein